MNNFLKYVVAFVVLILMIIGSFLAGLGLCEAGLHFPIIHIIVGSLALVVAVLIFWMMLVQFKKFLFDK